MDETAPWALAKRAGAGDVMAARRLDTVLWTLAECLRLLGVLLEPFLPDTGGRVLAQAWAGWRGGCLG